MPTQRIKGQEIECMILAGTEVVETFTDVSDMDLEFDIQLLEEGFLGRLANEYDEIFNGMKGSASFQVRRKAVFNFVLKVKDKAQRRTPGETFAFKATLRFPSGEVARVLLPDIHFGPIPLKVGGRAAFANMNIQFACSSCRII